MSQTPQQAQEERYVHIVRMKLAREHADDCGYETDLTFTLTATKDGHTFEFIPERNEWFIRPTRRQKTLWNKLP